LPGFLLTHPDCGSGDLGREVRAAFLLPDRSEKPEPRLGAVEDAGGEEGAGELSRGDRIAAT
jgi:hypothetical protein